MTGFVTTVCRNVKDMSKITFKKKLRRCVIVLNEHLYFSVLKFVSLLSRVLINLQRKYTTLNEHNLKANSALDTPITVKTSLTCICEFFSSKSFYSVSSSGSLFSQHP